MRRFIGEVATAIRRAGPVHSPFCECLCACKIRNQNVSVAHYASISARRKRTTFVTCWRSEPFVESARRTMRKRGIDYPKELSAVRHFVWLGPQQAVISPEFHAIPWRRSNPSLIAQSRPIGPASLGGCQPLSADIWAQGDRTKDDSTKYNSARPNKQGESSKTDRARRFNEGAIDTSPFNRTPARCSIM